MKTNEIKKGMRVRLRNGWQGTMKDNLKGNTRMVEVEGFVTEMGSVYAHDIVEVLTYIRPENSTVAELKWVRVEHTPAQLKLRKFAG